MVISDSVTDELPLLEFPSKKISAGGDDGGDFEERWDAVRRLGRRVKSLERAGVLGVFVASAALIFVALLRVARSDHYELVRWQSVAAAEVGSVIGSRGSGCGRSRTLCTSRPPARSWMRDSTARRTGGLTGCTPSGGGNPLAAIFRGQPCPLQP